MKSVSFTGEWLVGIGKDFRYALRSLSRSRGFPFVAVLSLAVGIGVNTAVFTAIHAVWLAPVPGVNGEDRVTEIAIIDNGREYLYWTFPDFLAVRDSETPIEYVTAWADGDATLGTSEGGQRVTVTYTTANYFRVLGVAPSLGRDFLDSEDVGHGEHAVVILSHDAWQNRLGGDPDIIGKTILLSRVPHTVVGVVPAPFRGTRPNSGNTDLWAPITPNAMGMSEREYMEDRETAWIRVLGRLQDDATLDQANVAVQTIFSRLAQEFPETNEHRQANAATFGRFPAQNRLGDQIAAGALAALLVLFLLIICGNLAGMVLARSAIREREFAVRLALGASRRRLVRQLMVESLVVAVAGGGLGIFLASWGMEAVPPTSLGIVAPGASFTPSPAILATAVALTLLTTLVFGLFPALRFSRPELVSSLKDDVGGGQRRVGRIHKFAAAAQTGLAMLCLVIGSLFLRSVGVMQEKPLGFEPDNLLIARMNLSDEGYPTLEEGGSDFLDRMGAALGALPGVTSVSFSDGIPLDRTGWRTWISPADRLDESDQRVTVEYTWATEDYFETIGTPILQGRGFRLTDDRGSEPVIVISKSLADKLWPGEEALGRQIRSGVIRDENRILTVVGVVANLASSRITADWPQAFIALRQDYRTRIMFEVRTTIHAAALAGPIRAAVQGVDPQLPIPEVVTAQSMVDRSRQDQLGIVRTAGALGVLALLLSAVGVYGVVALTVAHRTREIGVRMALGATQEWVLLSVLRDSVRLAIPGLVVGALLGIGAGFTMRHMLIGLSPLDPISFVAAGALLCVVVLLASLLPARRASAVNPVDALRSE